MLLERITSLRHRRVVRDGAWAAAGQGVTALVLLVGTRVTTQLVPDPKVLGAVSLLVGAVMLVRNVFFGPILQAQLRFYPDYAAHHAVGRLRREVGRPVRWSAAGIVGAALVAGWFVAGRTGVPWGVYAILAGLLVVDVWRAIEVGFLQAARRQRPLAILSAAETLARPTVMVLLVLWRGPSVATVLAGYLIGSAAVYLAMLGVMRREGVGEVAGEDDTGRRGPAAREMWRYALPLVPVAIVGWVTQISDRYLLGLFLGTTQVGIYSVTYGLMSQPFLAVGSVVARTLMPIYFKAVSDGHHDLERRTFRTWLLATAGVGVAGVAAVFVFRGLVARALLFEKYRGGVALMPWIAAGYAMYCVGTVFEQRLYARKLTGRVLVGNAVTAVASVVVPLAFLYKWGMVGVAAACPVYFGIMVVTMALLARHNPAGAGVATAARPNGAAGGVA